MTEVCSSWTKTVSPAKRGVAPGPSGMTFEHLRKVLFLVAEIMARAQISADIIGAVRGGRMTAFRKRTRGVRGIVAGDALRRLIARTFAQQMGEAVKAATAPFQCAFSTTAGCDSVVHALQVSTPNAPVTSIDGVSAHDPQTRHAGGVGESAWREGGLLVCFSFYGSPTWEDDGGVTHSIAQGEGGE